MGRAFLIYREEEIWGQVHPETREVETQMTMNAQQLQMPGASEREVRGCIRKGRISWKSACDAEHIHLLHRTPQQHTARWLLFFWAGKKLEVTC